MKNNSSRTAFIFKKLIIVIQENLVMNILKIIIIIYIQFFTVPHYNLYEI